MKIANYVNKWDGVKLVKAIERRISSEMTSFDIYIYIYIYTLSNPLTPASNGINSWPSASFIDLRKKGCRYEI